MVLTTARAKDGETNAADDVDKFSFKPIQSTSFIILLKKSILSMTKHINPKFSIKLWLWSNSLCAVQNAHYYGGNKATPKVFYGIVL